MIWNRFQWLFGAGFSGILLCVPGCGSDQAAAPGGAGAGVSTAGAGNVRASAGNAGSVSAGGPSGAGTAGAFGVAGAASSAGASTAGSAGSSGSVGSAGSVSPCHARPGLLACEDFETGVVGAAPTGAWSTGLIGDAGTVTVDDSVAAHSGSKSVHIHGSGYQTLLVYHDAAVLPQASGKFYVRAFLRLALPMVGGHNTFVIADTFAAPGAGNTLRVGEQNSMLMMTVGGDAHGYLSNQNYYNDHLPGVVLKAEAYNCLELLLDSTHTEIQVWVDGVDVPDLHVTNLPHENYDALRFGFEKYAGPDSDFWYDDIAIGSQRIGCD